MLALDVDREQVVCKEPLLAVDRQTGVNVVHPLGKVSPDCPRQSSGRLW
jgi:hypothetical protein